jgi:hypothetical protein
MSLDWAAIVGGYGRLLGMAGARAVACTLLLRRGVRSHDDDDDDDDVESTQQ